MNKKPKLATIPVLMGLTANLFFPSFGNISNFWNMFKQETKMVMPSDGLATLQGYALVQQVNPYTPIVVENRLVTITAYSSTPDQTDSTPFITALGTHVRDGIVACNFLRFGTRVRIPSLFGDKIFVVEDRMALKNSHKIDIWFETREEAKQFGLKFAQVEVLKYN